MKRIHKLPALLAASVLTLAMFSPGARASLVALDLNGSLPGGGTIVGSVSYDTTALDNNPNTIQGYFLMSAWDITVTPAAPDPGFHFQSGVSGHSGDVFRTTQNGENWITISLNASADFTDANLSLNFYDLELPVSPNIAPDLEDYGAFISTLFGGALRSEYTLDGGPGNMTSLIVDSATVIPEPSAALLGLMGMITVLRRRRS